MGVPGLLTKYITAARSYRLYASLRAANGLPVLRLVRICRWFFLGTGGSGMMYWYVTVPPP